MWMILYCKVTMRKENKLYPEVVDGRYVALVLHSRWKGDATQATAGV